jgi:nucleoside-diphosphate-sugar epimerase
VQLLAAGHQVRTTVRNRSASRRCVLLKEGSAEPGERLALSPRISSTTPSGRRRSPAATTCCTWRHRFPASVPKHEDELIVPAREGALRVLRAARDAGVQRVVLTSSFAAIGYGHQPQSAPFDETTWTDLDGGDIRPYVKSKTLAERAAWDFIAREGKSLELSVVNPVGVLGPVLGADYSTSILLVQRLMDGAVPGLPKLCFGVVDVRDIADLHLRAMTAPEAKGERFLGVAGHFLSMVDIARVLKARMGAAAKRAPTAKANRLLGWSPRSNDDCIVATPESLVRLQLLKGQPQSRGVSHQQARSCPRAGCSPPRFCFDHLPLRIHSKQVTSSVS